MRAPEGHCWISKTYENCNYLQAMEGGLDTSHSSFLHRNLDKDGLTNPRVRSTAPRLEVLNTDYGYMYASIRHLPEEKQNFVRVYHYVMPFYQLRAGGAPNQVGNTDGHIWVPIDDETCWAWNFHLNISEPMSYEQWQTMEHRMGRGLAEDFVPGGNFRLKANASNDFFMSRERQKTVNYTGIEGTNTQDFAVQESMGPIYDRTKEHLGSADTAIIQMRRLLLDAVRDVGEGKDPDRIARRRQHCAARADVPARRRCLDRNAAQRRARSSVLSRAGPLSAQAAVCLRQWCPLVRRLQVESGRATTLRLCSSCVLSRRRTAQSKR